ncbi:LacI family transcriptional regulator [Clostridium tagluense]|uniref:LacI family DNA-binding transcriptional regulator n=1 Tax=Clostridium TaxID=1485 RepID=UPI0013E96661|nr:MULTISPECIES: LacI family DNA-binding transcriptional regulator [Clostridium]MBU3126147.1 LacI family transcriptional regulator [Clostridium tagluense]MBW9155828.1 LacI family transcriptional regulator [Clostridium tagluense]MBZ9623987.1 LacI family transcriptional regulator [Clostridium sp. FP2]MCB2309528.1 LacI family transcriptional regulator [Clostridium tagluense]MCB2314942.1 LacI family transcriptional regulator [Clostridium tagluense]
MNNVTMKDIAEMAGVSKATVSMVMNKKDASISEVTRKRILKIAKEMSYIPNSIARSLSTKKSGTIGIILPDITNPFFSEMVRAIEDKAERLEYNLIICNTDNDIEKEQKYIELLISKLIDGIIFMSGGKSNESITILKNNNVPFVLVDRYIEGYKDDYGVFCLNKQGVIDGVQYLYEKGNRKIVFVKGREDIEISKQRLEGYIDAMKNYGIYDEKYIFEGDFNVEGGIIATKKIISCFHDLDAIFYSNDMMALGGMKILLRNDYKIPRDISIIGFDNIHISEIIEPELTTISQPIYMMGKKACSILIDVINGKLLTEKQVYFKTELIIRGTT